jgi:nitrogen fixation/metabolism regulation signal transduction histidine kinase
LLQVHFTEETNGTLVCIIEDNGIGRQASWSGKSTTGYENKHTGKGIAVATERLKVFNEHSGLGNSLEITDLTDIHGHASGTKVVVKFMA